MDVINRFIRRKRPIKTTIWGIRVPQKVKIRWLMMSAMMRVPTNRLILFVLNDWAQDNSDTLLDEQSRN